MRDPTAPPHIGVLLDNTPEYLFWLGAAAISRLGRGRRERDVPGRRAGPPGRPLRVPGAGDRRRPRAASSPTRPSPWPGIACCAPTPTATSPRCADVDADRSWPTRRRRRPVPADLHVRLDGVPQGGAVLAGPLRPQRPPRRRGRRARTGIGRLRAAALLPHGRPVHRVVERAERRRPDRHPGPLLGVAHHGGRAPHGGDDVDLHGQGPELHPRPSRRRPTTPRRPSSWPSATRRRRPTSASSPPASAARSATATGRPRA